MWPATSGEAVGAIASCSTGCRSTHPRPTPADLVDDGLAHASLAALPVREREVIVLRLVDGLSERETAEALGISIGTVKSRLSRGRMRLRVDLEGAAIDSRGVGNEA